VLGTVVAMLATAGTAHGAITVSDATAVTEGNGGTVNLTFTIARDGGLLQGDASVRFRTTGGSATSGSDYTAVSGTTYPLPGDLFGTSVEATVAVHGDLLDEPDENVVVTIDQLEGGTEGETISDDTGTGTITDNDPIPTIAIGAGSRFEGTGGEGYVVLPVTLSAPSGRIITAPYTVSPGTATDPQDIDATARSVTIPAGTSDGEIRVPVITDNIDEPDETFTVTLGAPANATLGNAAAQGTVLNDDTPVVSIAGVELGEGTGAEPTAFPFLVTLSNPSARAITVRAGTADAQAKAPEDYAALDTTVTFAPGDVTEVVTVNVVADAIVEASESFAVNLSEPAGATLGTATALGAIQNDDTAPTGGGTTGGGTTGGGGGTATVPGGTVTATPTVGPITPPTAPSTDRTAPKVGLTGLAFRKPWSIRVKVTCPVGETRCVGTVTIFSVAQRRSRHKVLRRETRLVRGRFSLAGGASRTLTLAASGEGLRVLRTVKRLKVRGYGVATDAAGNVGTRTVSGTLRRR